MCRQDEGESAELDNVDASTQSKKSLVKMVNKLWNQDQISKLEERGLSSKADQKRARPALAHRIVVMEGAPTTSPPCSRDGCRWIPLARRRPWCHTGADPWTWLWLGRAGAQGQRAHEWRAHLPAQQAPARRAQEGPPPCSSSLAECFFKVHVFSFPHLALLYEKGIRLKPSGNEVHYTISLTLPVKNMLCSQLRCQIFGD